MRKKKKILIVGPNLSLRAGVSFHVRTILTSPLNRNYRIEYFKVGSDQDDRLIAIGLSFMAAPVRFLSRLWRYHPDLVHLNPSFDPKSLLRELLLVALCKIHHRSVLVQFHGGNLLSLAKNNRIPFYVRLLLQWSDHLVVLTDIQRQSLLKYCPAEKVTVIPNMIDTTKYHQRNHRSNSVYRVLYMSKLETKKGVYDALESVQHVIKRFSNVKFFFAGDGPDKEKLQLLCCESGLEDHIKIIGYVQDKRKSNFLASGDLFLFPSHYKEGMPYALLEAMAAGLPVVATAVGGIPEIIENRVNGLLIPPRQPKELSKAIIKLLSNQNTRRNFGLLNRYKAKTRYDIHVVCEKFKELYEKLS